MRWATLGSIVLVLACDRGEGTGEPATEREPATARAEIESLAADYERWVAAGHIDSVAALLADDAYVLPPDHPPLAGRAAWLAWARPLFSHGAWTDDLTIESVDSDGDLAIERGRYVMTFTPDSTSPPGAIAMTDRGKYLQHWRRIDGRWRMAAAIWNRDSSPAGSP